MSAYLVDSNLLLRSVQEGHPSKPIAVNAIKTLLDRGEQVCLVPQVLYEFYVVCTRPVGENGLGMTPPEALQEMNRLTHLLPTKPDDVQLMLYWMNLLNQYDVIGKQAHDTRLVAAMLTHGMTHILTFNGGHFDRYQEITVVQPGDLQP